MDAARGDFSALARGLLLTVIVAMATTLVGPSSATADSGGGGGGCQTLPCCMPNQWQGKQVIREMSAGFGTIFTTRMRAEVTYDAVNERQVFIVNKTNSYGTYQRYKFFGFYKEKYGYTYDLDTKKCQVQNLNTFPKRCVPDNFKVMDPEVTLGSQYNQLTATRVTYETPSGGNTIYGDLLLIPGCYPVAETRHTTKGSTFSMRKTSFEDIREGIESEDIFTLPAACQRVNAGR